MSQFTSIVLFILACIQFYNAKQETIKAAKALEMASEVQIDLTKQASETQQTFEQIVRINQRMFSIVLVLMKIETLLERFPGEREYLIGFKEKGYSALRSIISESGFLAEDDSALSILLNLE